MMELVLYWFCRVLLSSLISMLVMGSRPDVGSSYNMISGFRINVLAIPILFFLSTRKISRHLVNLILLIQTAPRTSSTAVSIFFFAKSFKIHPQRKLKISSYVHCYHIKRLFWNEKCLLLRRRALSSLSPSFATCFPRTITSPASGEIIILQDSFMRTDFPVSRTS